MPHHTESRLLPYTAPQLFDLVADVQKYPEFLPWCVGSRVYQKTDHQFTADVLIGYKILREKYTCIVHLDAPKRIYVHYVSGPFSRLDNTWTFQDQGDGTCLLTFTIDFMFKSLMLQTLATSLFHEIIHRMVRAFEGRAAGVYGVQVTGGG
jgi:coenzyme Q-binding protein COQ10